MGLPREKHLINTKAPTRFFKKRTYTFKTFITDFTRMMRKRHSIMDTHHSHRLSRQFAEHIMLVCTTVYGCIYCEWGHTKNALNEGSTLENIQALLALNFGQFPPEEVIALSFAQQYAETAGHPSEVALRRLVREYGLKKSQDIINHCEMITMGNLLGNSISALLNRLQKIPPEHGSLGFELFIFLLGGFWIDRYISTLRA